MQSQGCCLGDSILADQSRIHLVEKSQYFDLYLWISGPWGHERTINFHVFRSADSFPFSHIALVSINFFFHFCFIGRR